MISLVRNVLMTIAPQLAARILSYAGLLVLLTFNVRDTAHGADLEFGRHLAGACVTCHLTTGQTIGAIPAIVGWPADTFIAVMTSYQRKEREHQAMQAIAGALQEDEIAAIAAYFASLKPQ